MKHVIYCNTKYAHCSRFRESNCNLPGQVSVVNPKLDVSLLQSKPSSNHHRCSHGFIEDQPKEWTQLDYHSEVGK